MASRAHSEHPRFHAVKFYDSDSSLCPLVAEFLAQGVITGQPALVIATPEHRKGIIRELKARHFDVASMERAGDLLMLDAAETLSTLLVDGAPDRAVFETKARAVIDGISRSRENCTIRVYGEMVDLLCKRNQAVDAVRLEMWWNALTSTGDFVMLCGYSMRNGYEDAQVTAICSEHTHIVTGEGQARPVTPPSIN